MRSSRVSPSASTRWLSAERGPAGGAIGLRRAEMDMHVSLILDLLASPAGHFKLVFFGMGFHLSLLALDAGGVIGPGHIEAAVQREDRKMGGVYRMPRRI